jgi:peptide/nickel transport system permease protein
MTITAADRLSISRSPIQRMIGKLGRNPRFIFGFFILTASFIAALIAPWVAPYPLGEAELVDRLCTPSAQHLLGCDMDGQDILTQMLYGSRISLYVAFLTVALSLGIGSLLGLVSGYFRGWFDLALMRLVDVFMAFPGILLALTLTAIMGPSFYTVVFSIAATGWTSTARLVRGQVLSVREREFVLASRALGASGGRLIFKHIFPAILSPLVVHATFSLSGVIIVEAGLSFLGFGARDSALTWGGLLGQASQVELDQATHLALIPGLAIFLLVMALNLMGDALRDALDPRS